MARNAHPDETVRKILEISTQLFLERGYDATSLQDIIHAVGMSKGAIYHHFKSKEELFSAAIDNFYATEDDDTRQIAERTDLNALEKLQEILRRQLGSQKKQLFDALSIRFYNNDPRLQMASLRSNISEGAPVLADLIRQGNGDGSLHVRDPLEAAELLLIMLNVWLGEFAGGPARFRRQLHLCAEVLTAIGMPLIDEELSGLCWEYYCAMHENLAAPGNAAEAGSTSPGEAFRPSCRSPAALADIPEE